MQGSLVILNFLVDFEKIVEYFYVFICNVAKLLDRFCWNFGTVKGLQGHI